MELYLVGQRHLKSNLAKIAISFELDLPETILPEQIQFDDFEILVYDNF